MSNFNVLEEAKMTKNVITVTTYSELRQKVWNILGKGNVVHHKPEGNNKLGQSGVHTFIVDIIDIVLNSTDEREAYSNIYHYLEDNENEK